MRWVRGLKILRMYLGWILDDYELLDDLFRACGEEGSTMDQNKLPAEQNGLAPRGRIGAWIKQKIVGGRKDWMV